MAGSSSGGWAASAPPAKGSSEIYPRRVGTLAFSLKVDREVELLVKYGASKLALFCSSVMWDRRRMSKKFGRSSGLGADPRREEKTPV